MALSESTVWEVRGADGNDLNGAGFNATRDAVNGVDYSQQAAAQLSLTDLACASNTTLTSVTGGFTHAMEGNLVYIASGTNALAGFYEITVYTNTNTVTIDRTCATGGNMTAGVGKVGGAAATPGMIGAVVVRGNTIYCKGDQTIAYATSNVSGGCINSSISCVFIGYATTRSFNNSNTRPIFTVNAGVTGATIFTGTYIGVSTLSLNGAGVAASCGVGSAGFVYRCHLANFTNGGISIPYSGVVFCTATGCSSAAALNGNAVFCEAYNNSYAGFGTSGSYAFCISSGNTTSNGHGFISDGGRFSAFCIAYGNAGTGFLSNAATSSRVFINCIAESNSGYGWYYPTSSDYGINKLFINCAHYNNTSGSGLTGSYSFQIGTIAITAGSVFTDAAAGDFSLNNTANCGALLRSVGFPVLFPRGLTANYLDVGAARHADPAGGSGVRDMTTGIMRGMAGMLK